MPKKVTKKMMRNIEFVDEIYRLNLLDKIDIFFNETLTDEDKQLSVCKKTIEIVDDIWTWRVHKSMWNSDGFIEYMFIQTNFDWVRSLLDMRIPLRNKKFCKNSCFAYKLVNESDLTDKTKIVRDIFKFQDFNITY